MRRSSAPSFRNNNSRVCNPVDGTSSDEDNPSTASIISLIRSKRHPKSTNSMRENIEKHFSAVYALPSSKKNKTWTDDGYIGIEENIATLKDIEGTVQGIVKLKTDLNIGDRLFIGPYEAELVELMSSKPVKSIAPENVEPAAQPKIQLKPNLLSVNIDEPKLRPHNSNDQYFSVIYAKQSARKHKIWSGDGFITIKNNYAILKDMYGVVHGTTKLKAMEDSISIGDRLVIGQYEAELIDRLKTLPIYTESNLIVDKYEPCSSKHKLEMDQEFENKSKKRNKSQALFKPVLFLGK